MGGSFTFNVIALPFCWTSDSCGNPQFMPLNGDGDFPINLNHHPIRYLFDLIDFGNSGWHIGRSLSPASYLEHEGPHAQSSVSKRRVWRAMSKTSSNVLFENICDQFSRFVFWCISCVSYFISNSFYLEGKEYRNTEGRDTVIPTLHENRGVFQSSARVAVGMGVLLDSIIQPRHYKPWGIETVNLRFPTNCNLASKESKHKN